MLTWNTNNEEQKIIRGKRVSIVLRLHKIARQLYPPKVSALPQSLIKLKFKQQCRYIKGKNL